ncbi:MAG: SctK family type III secretion system sorting platform protein [Burkholderiaceae bacterium]|nr:SctK family type III secretion system sorting platform protein [Burkholderiaceae bacterium]
MSDFPPDAGLAHMVSAQADLLRSICVFNQSPADYLDDSRRAEFFPAQITGPIWTCVRARRHLSRHILERIGAEPCLQAHRPEWPVVLLDRPRIDRLARHVAAALVGARVRRSISRVEVLKWREWLATDAHEFALKRASLLPISADAGANAQRVPAQQLGHIWMVAASRQWPEAMARRFILKLPAGHFREAEAIDGALASRLVSSVLNNLESRWCSSFATTRA